MTSYFFIQMTQMVVNKNRNADFRLSANSS
jgi:hypothetical protein